MKIRIAVSPSAEPFDAVEFARFATTLEGLGFDTMWLSDVVLGHAVDPLVGLTFAAALTTRLKLGANVVPIGRNPMRLARELAQIDRVSNGRVLISLVPGLKGAPEQAAMGALGSNRGEIIDEVIPLLRRWWSGESVSHSSDRFDFRDVTVAPGPLQDPLEIWLGGSGPAALRRAGEFSDGWLGATVSPAEAGIARRKIDEHAASVGRVIDPEHHGLSIGYCREGAGDAVAASMAALVKRRPDLDVRHLFAVGESQLVDLLGGYIDEGLSKFVLRPMVRTTPWDEELGWLASVALPLQT
jgi:probable F420-dependent oxidoreductase